MPAKSTRSQATVSRGRSKSVGRSETPSRQRSRSRTRSKERTTKRSRTPVSESKVTRRRRSSVSEKVVRPSGDHEVKTTKKASSGSEATPLTRIVTRKFEQEKVVTEVQEKPIQKKTFTEFCPIWRNMKPVCQEMCPLIVKSFLILFTVPFAIWLNLLVLPSPVSGQSSESVKHDLYGPFLGVYWPTDWKTYINHHSFLQIATFFVLHFLIARFLPVGRLLQTVNGSQRIKYYCNALGSFIIIGGLAAFAECSDWMAAKGLKPSTMLPKYHLSLLVSACILAYAFSAMVFCASRRNVRLTRQTSEKRGSIITDIWDGRITRPYWFNLDWKMFIWRPGYFGLVLLEVTLLLGQIEQYKRFSPSLACLIGMHAILLLDSIIFEHTRFQSHDVQTFGFGHRVIVHNLIEAPFLYSVAATYLSTRPDVGRKQRGSIVLPYQCDPCLLGTSVLLFVLGFWIYRASKNQKDRFRKEPHHPSLASLDIIAGPGSQRILAGGWWGWVRHPDYVGELLMGIAMAITFDFQSVIPWIYPMVWLCDLFFRLKRCEEASAKEHGPAWWKYTSIVRYRLLPRVC